MYRRIILAVDLEGTLAPRGLDQAVELAVVGGGELRLVNVQPMLPVAILDVIPDDFNREREGRAAAALRDVEAKINIPRERVSSAVLVGDVYRELLKEAAEWRADLIIVASHRPAMSDYLLGSNAETIVRHAKCSVLVAR
jgi:nucleotide-binding universal stress UspA family protein